MNAALKDTFNKVPVRTIKVATGTIAIGSSSFSILEAWLGPPFFSIGIGYVLVPLALALVVSLALAVARLVIVGVLPSNVSDDVAIPLSLQPWIRRLLLIRFGLMFSGLLIIIIGVIGTLVRLEFLGIAVYALVNVVLARFFFEAIFGAVFNAGVIHQMR